MCLIQILKNYKKSDIEAKILIMELDSSGKTTILRQISNEQISSI
jgi:AAA+ ATPase superfamily predicted ATPase